MAASLAGFRPALSSWVWVPSPQSKSSHSLSQATATALTLRFSVGLPDPVPSVITLITYEQYHDQERESIRHGAILTDQLSGISS